MSTITPSVYAPSAALKSEIVHVSQAPIATIPQGIVGVQPSAVTVRTQPLTGTGIDAVESRQIFINDISGDTTTTDLRALFSAAGKVTNVEIDTNELNRHFAFVTFSSYDGVENAIAQFTTAQLKNTTLVVRRRSELEQMRLGRMIEARCKLFVGNIPQDMGPDQLKYEIERLSQRPITDFRHKKGYCFVGFSSPAHAEAAKRNLKNAICGGKSLNAEFKKEDPIRNEPGFIAVLEQAQRTLYVRDIPAMTDAQHFKQIFEQFGKVRKFTLPTEKHCNKLVGYAFIEYFWKDHCDKALAATQGLKFNGQTVEIRISDPPKDKASDRPGMSHRRRRGGGGGGERRDRDYHSSRRRDRHRSRSRSRSRSRDRNRGNRSHHHSNGYGAREAHHTQPISHHHPPPHMTAHHQYQPAPTYSMHSMAMPAPHASSYPAHATHYAYAQHPHHPPPTHAAAASHTNAMTAPPTAALRPSYATNSPYAVTPTPSAATASTAASTASKHPTAAAVPSGYPNPYHYNYHQYNYAQYAQPAPTTAATASQQQSMPANAANYYQNTKSVQQTSTNGSTQGSTPTASAQQTPNQQPAPAPAQQAPATSAASPYSYYQQPYATSYYQQQPTANPSQQAPNYAIPQQTRAAYPQQPQSYPYSTAHRY